MLFHATHEGQCALLLKGNHRKEGQRKEDGEAMVAEGAAAGVGGTGGGNGSGTSGGARGAARPRRTARAPAAGARGDAVRVSLALTAAEARGDAALQLPGLPPGRCGRARTARTNDPPLSALTFTEAFC